MRFCFYILFVAISITKSLQAQSLTNRVDSVLSYKNGKDSIRVIFKKNKIHKEIFYFPDGKKKSEIITIKDKRSKHEDYRQVKSKYITWNEEGKIIERSRLNSQRRDFANKYVSRTFKENGKWCLKKEVKPWGTKN